MYKRRMQTLALSVLFGSLAVTVPAVAGGQARPATDQSSPDNTKINKRDRAKGEPTADQQKENAADRELSRKIRRSVVSDKSLSTYAHNVKIIAQHGTVTLKGPVHTDDEKKAIEAKAIEVAGKENVKSEITVKGDAQADRAK